MESGVRLTWRPRPDGALWGGKHLVVAWNKRLVLQEPAAKGWLCYGNDITSSSCKTPHLEMCLGPLVSEWSPLDDKTTSGTLIELQSNGSYKLVALSMLLSHEFGAEHAFLREKKVARKIGRYPLKSHCLQSHRVSQTPTIDRPHVTPEQLGSSQDSCSIDARRRFFDRFRRLHGELLSVVQWDFPSRVRQPARFWQGFFYNTQRHLSVDEAELSN